MTTVIDALTVQLGLDPKDFVKGQKEAAASFAKTKDLFKKSAGEVEDSAKKATGSIGGLAKAAIELFAIFTAGKGLKDFIADVTVADSQAGRLARTLDMGVSNLSAWQGAATLVGGSAQGISGTIQNLVSQFQQFKLTGESSIIPYMNRLGVSLSDAYGNMRDMGDVLLDLSDAVKSMDPARASAWLRGAGVTDQGTINLLLQGCKAVQGMLDDQKRLGVITKEDAAAGMALVYSWDQLIQASTSMGRNILTWAAPALVKMNDALTNLAVWAREHGPFVKAMFVGLTALVIGLAAAATTLWAPLLPILALVAALGAAVVAGALLYDDWKTWTEGGKALFGGFWKFWQDGWNFAVAVFSGSSDQIKATWKKLFDDLKSQLSKALPELAKALGEGLLNAVKDAWNAYLYWILGRVNALRGLLGLAPLSAADVGLTGAGAGAAAAKGGGGLFGGGGLRGGRSGGAASPSVTLGAPAARSPRLETVRPEGG
jgi:hypothetical protein